MKSMYPEDGDQRKRSQGSSLDQTFHNFLGRAPVWFKLSILIFFILNPLILKSFGSFVAGWCVLAEFIFTLALALRCYPLQSGGLLALEAVLLGLIPLPLVYEETSHSLPVILLLIFMVAAVHFMRETLFFGFMRLVLFVRNKLVISVLVCFLSAVLSAFLDALTVTAVLISVCSSFYQVFQTAASAKGREHDPIDGADWENFRGFLQSLLMHGAVGTALGGVCTSVGEPQNLLISSAVGWDFLGFFRYMAPVTLPIMGASLILCLGLERSALFGYGKRMPASAWQIIEENARKEGRALELSDYLKMYVQIAVGIFIVCGLGFHWTEPGLLGLAAVVVLTALNGITDEHTIGDAFRESLPFVSLLVVFFSVVAMIKEQGLFTPVFDLIWSLPEDQQLRAILGANGILSMISDNVFVATVYIDQIKSAFDQGLISRSHFEELARATNVGTNLPSIATPNGQAAFLFLLTSALAPSVKLGYGRMIVMALPYTILVTALAFWLL